MLRNFKCLLIGLCLSYYSCVNEDLSSDDGVILTQNTAFKVTPKLTVPVALTKARIDREAINQLGLYEEHPEKMSIYELYDQSLDEVDSWTDKLWGRCCTEADMRFSEFLGFEISCDNSSKSYPFSNALDNLFATTFAFKEKENINMSVSFKADNDMYGRLKNKTIDDLIKEKDTIQRFFQISIVNGYAKSAETFTENGRIKEVELWLNGEHKCNCILLDTVAIQIIQGNFPFFKNDTIQIVPVTYYPGEKYDDVCISAIQRNLGYGANPSLDKLNKYLNY